MRFANIFCLTFVCNHFILQFYYIFVFTIDYWLYKQYNNTYNVIPISLYFCSLFLNKSRKPIWIYPYGLSVLLTNLLVCFHPLFYFVLSLSECQNEFKFSCRLGAQKNFFFVSTSFQPMM